MKTFIEVLASGFEYDTQCVSNPHEWYFAEKNGIYYPIQKIDFNSNI